MLESSPRNHKLYFSPQRRSPGKHKAALIVLVLLFILGAIYNENKELINKTVLAKAEETGVLTKVQQLLPGDSNNQSPQPQTENSLTDPNLPPTKIEELTEEEKLAELQKLQKLIDTDYKNRAKYRLSREELMKKIKTRGCVADGLFTGYGGETEKDIEMVNRSECEYLHRSIETWLEPPDFEEIKENMDQMKKNNVIYGMFIAEAIDRKSDYEDSSGKEFDFSDMCRPGSKHYWGEHSCKPSFKRDEYRDYLRYITRRAMDLGVQSFMFGQVFYQESTDLDDPEIEEIIAEMRQYAGFLGIEIVIGAQTNSITHQEYLQHFDYIEGGVGVSPSGNIEDGPCFSRWWKKPGDWCWALLWHDRYANQANHILLHLDWSGKLGDDMSTFARMNPNLRSQTLERLYLKFTEEGHGFLMPMLAILPDENGSCYGGKKGYYSANEEFDCADEEAINKILKKHAPPSKEEDSDEE